MCLKENFLKSQELFKGKQRRPDGKVAFMDYGLSPILNKTVTFLSLESYCPMSLLNITNSVEPPLLVVDYKNCRSDARSTYDPYEMKLCEPERVRKIYSM